jgi:hypothetical protein
LVAAQDLFSPGMGLGGGRLGIYPPLASPGRGPIGTCQPAAPGDIRAPAAGALRPECGRRVRQRRGAPDAGSGSLLPTSPAHPWAEAAPAAGRPGRPGLTATAEPALVRDGSSAPSARRAAAPRPRAPRRGRTWPGRQSPRPPLPGPGEPAPLRRGGGGLGFKDTLTQAG